MSSLTINIDDVLKKTAQQKVKQEGVTLTFVLTQALKAYNQGKLKFGLLSEDNEITTSFEVSTKEGKEACLNDFKSLIS